MVHGGAEAGDGLGHGSVRVDEAGVWEHLQQGVECQQVHITLQQERPRL